MEYPKESDGFIREKYREPKGCCHSKHTRNCCVAAAVFGAAFVALGVVVLVAGKGLLEKKIAASMAITEGSDRLQSWLTPPVTAYMEAYAFDVTNPEAVLAGRKPVVAERGPYVYKSETVKDSDGNMEWGDETLAYRPRKIYTFVPELSRGNDPDKDFLTFPNIPFWTGMNKARKSSGFAQGIAHDIIKNNGLGTPFVNVSVSGILWGYDDELPCMTLDMPQECSSAGKSGGGGFGDDSGFGDDDGFGGFDDDDGFGGSEDDDDDDDEEAGGKSFVADVSDFKPPKDSYWEKQVKPKAEFIDCKCKWGLFRDRNVTMRKPIQFNTGVKDVAKKGVVTSFDRKKVFEWWKKGSLCDKVKGQDGPTIPPNVGKGSTYEIFIALMCRTMKMEFEKVVHHAGIETYRFIPPTNALGRHDDADPERRNPDNECYCVEEDGYTCFKSGVMNMEPCKREVQAPLALSQPHFYQADESYLNSVHGLKPEKEKHEFYMDLVPQFGFPLSIQPRFQLNLVIFRQENYPALANMEKEIVLPFFWAQVGFNEPSEAMANQIKFGLEAPDKLPMLGAVVLFALGGLLLIIPLSYFVWRRRSDKVQLNGVSKSVRS